MRVPRPLLPVAFAGAAFVAVLWITRPPGPGLDPDAMSYLGAAESFAESSTLRIPVGMWDSPDGTEALGHFPPGFSIVLAGPVALGVEPVQAARVLEAVSAAAAAGMVVWMALAVGGPAAAALAGILLFVTPGFALDHLRVLSEPLFLALAALTLLLMWRAPDRPLAHGLVAAAASVVRYAGASLGGAAALWALSRPGTLRRRLWSATLAIGPTVVVQVAWALRTRAEAAQVRTFGLKSGLGSTLHEGWDTLTAWLSPGVEQPVFRAVLALAVFVLVAAVLWNAARRERTFFAATGLAAACYAGLVLLSRLFADERIPLDERLLSPLFLFVSLGVASAAGMLWSEGRQTVRSTGALLLALWLGASAWRTGVTVQEAREGGWGYAGTDWRQSDLVRWLRSEGAGYALFSDNPADVWFATGRRSWKLPDTLAPDSVSAFAAALRRRHGVVIGFASPLEEMARPDSLAARLGLGELARFEGGVVWGPARP
jgi:hypothetical protein